VALAMAVALFAVVTLIWNINCSLAQGYIIEMRPDKKIPEEAYNPSSHATREDVLSTVKKNYYIFLSLPLFPWTAQ